MIRFRFTIASVVFWTIFAAVFLFSAVLSLIPGLPYEMGAVSLLAMALLIAYGLPLERELFLILSIVLVVVASAVVNRRPADDLILFLRTPVIAYLGFRTVCFMRAQHGLNGVIRVALIVGYIQLPVVLLQGLLYQYYPLTWMQKFSLTDAQFGTFNLASDAPMSIFLTLLIILMLFDERAKRYVSRPRMAALWFTLPILISNSELSKLMLAVIWIVYFILELGARKAVVLSLLLASLILTGSGYLGADTVPIAIKGLDPTLDEAAFEQFQAGGYARQAAITYFAGQPVEWLGAGPGAYFDVLKGTFSLGVHGHMLLTYSEVGIVALLLTYLFFWSIAAGSKVPRLISIPQLLAFLTIVAHSITIPVMTDLSVVVGYSIFAGYFITTTAQTGLASPHGRR